MSGHSVSVIRRAAVAIVVVVLSAAAFHAATPRADGATAGELDRSAQARLDAAFEAGFARSGAAGATLGLWIPGRGEWVASKGVADRVTGTPMTRAMQAPIGSVTKTYTVLVALQLVDEGVLHLDDTIDHWYPAYPDADAITLRMLMNHSSGIADISAEQIAIKCATPHLVVDPDALIAVSAGVPRAAPFAPGQGSEYSSANTIILGRILEQVTGTSYERLLSDRLFQPLGLTRTRLDADGVLEAPYTHGYTDFCVPTLPAGTDTSSWTMIAFSAGALASTIDDLHTYGVAFGAGYGLDAATKQARLDDTAPTDPTSGLGLVQVRDAAGRVVSIGHAGSEPGYGSNLLYFPCSGAVFAAMTNADFSPALLDILGAVQPVAQELATADCPSPSPAPAPAPTPVVPVAVAPRFTG